MPKITPCLWFDGKAEEAANFYVSIFKDSKITGVTRMTVTFQLAGQDYIALNGGPQYKFTPALSLSVTCQTQEEVDAYWEKLTAGGAEVQCGWLTDRYGVSWQIVPAMLGEVLGGADAAGSSRAMQAMLTMKKLDIAALGRAYAGET